MCHKNAIEMINTKKSYSVFYSVHFVTFGPILSILFGLIRHIRSYLVHFGLKIASIRNKHYFFLKKKPNQNKIKQNRGNLLFQPANFISVFGAQN